MKNQEKNSAIAMSREIQSSQQDINNVLTTSQAVSGVFHDHWVEMETGKNGIANLISKILSEKEAVFPKGIENTEFRSVAISTSLFASDIIKEVQSQFTAGSIRYPYFTIHTYLSVFMFRKNKVGKIKLSNSEDSERDCCKPRTKYYLVQ